MTIDKIVTALMQRVPGGPLVPFDDCTHTYVRVDKEQDDGDGGKLPQFTCDHPKHSRCLGTFYGKEFHEKYRFSMRYHGTVYLRRKEGSE